MASRGTGATSTPCRNPSLRSSMMDMDEKMAVNSTTIIRAPGKKYCR